MSRVVSSFWAVALLVAATASHAVAATTITQKISPSELDVGDQAQVSITVQNGSVDQITLPLVTGLQVAGTSTSTNLEFGNGTFTRSTTFSFGVVPSRPGDFVIPAFDVKAGDGTVLHVGAMKLHVLDSGTGSQPLNVAPAAPAQAPQASTPNTPANPNGPVVMPPTNAATNPTPPTDPTTTTTSTEVGAPRDPDGGPAKVFIIITPGTTDAYVGQSIPLRIDFYIRMEVNRQQNSLPTIKGSDFLINNFNPRGQVGTGLLENIQYMRESWSTAISAPKSGDFPLVMQQDTYWVKSVTSVAQNSLFGTFFAPHQNLAHELIPSNLLMMHIHALPEEGRPDHFTGAIGQLKVTGQATPSTVNVGEPVTLRFTVSGEGNFDYVRSPALSDDPNWKAYVPSSKTSYLNEAHTSATKSFEQSIIPHKNGNVPLPAAKFSYFDPTLKQYVTVPVPLPVIAVTGTVAPVATALPDSGSDVTTTAATPSTMGFLPNRLDLGSLRTSLTPAYRQPLFWAVQTAFISLPIIAGLLLWYRSRFLRDDGKAERELRLQSEQHDKDAMAEAVRAGDAVQFFIIARHAIQMQLGAQWHLKPEAITFGEIRTRDPQLAETLEPLFTQADEVIYSGKATPGLNLAEWEKRVRTELLQPQFA